MSFTFPNAPHFDKASCDALPVVWVSDENALYQLIDEIDDSDIIALDTEFIKRTTYYPILALVQVNTGRAIYLVDAPKLDLHEFWQALIEVPTMVWYACGEDLGIFYLLAKNTPLTNVFDVQIAIGYLTGKLQVGYSQSIKEVLGIELDKGESQSNWLARPLSQEQEHYAVNDVRYLLALYQATKDALHAKNTLEFVIEDSLTYAKELHAAQAIPDDELYLEFIAPNYNRQQLSVLKQLILWRENLARSTNEPRSYIIGKQALREIVMDMPTTIKGLARTTLNRHALRLYGDEMIRLIKSAKGLDTDELVPLPPPVYTSKDKPFKKALDRAIDEHSEAIGVPRDLLLRSRHVAVLLLMVYQKDSQDSFDMTNLPDSLLGYRKTWIMETVLPLLATFKPQIEQGFLAGENERV